MLSAFTRSLARNIVKDTPMMMSARFSNKTNAADTTSEKWPPYNVCSIPFNVKKNDHHIKLKEPHKRFATAVFSHL